ncbi:MAG: ferrochelatase [Hydrogenophilales bacterium 17-61-76]|nr:MAG: ferrochelatase [Hydrogenophilales bacterium 17-61-76]
MKYLKEPDYAHGQQARTGILLVNLGTPAAPTAKALRPYLKEFLSDPRVVEIPRLVWWLILNGIILNTRPKKSAEKYASIWTTDGSPLRVHTEKQAKLLQGWLGEKVTSPIKVEYAMRYGQPSVTATLAKMKADGCDRILILPAYPQYAASSTGTAFDMAFAWLQKVRNQPALRTLKHYHDHPGYIAALASNIRDDWQKNGRPDVLSRFGRAEWIQPYTDKTLEALGKEGVKRVDVVAPGFTSDCLETLEELAMEGRETFLKAGGKEFRYIPALNEHPQWIAALGQIALENLGGWVRLDDERNADEAERQASRNRALAMGART